MLILGIETSCDETSVAILEGDGRVRANLIASQIERHQPFGGVVPEIASREHLQHLMPLVERALSDTGTSLDSVTAIAVTSGPGLIGALLVGVAGAQGLAYGLDIPLVAVNHLEGHIYSPYLQSNGPALEVPERGLSIVVSGGHSSVYALSRDGRIVMINRTRDDAAGEVFDKVAKFIGLPYPGGPHVERIGREGDASRFKFAVAQLKGDTFDFSFSGLKSNAIRIAREEGLHQHVAEPDAKRAGTLADFCASFQRAIGDQILDRLTRIWSAMESRPDELPTELALAGGVAANGALRERIAAWCGERGIAPRLPEKKFCTDNGAMIAFAGIKKIASARDPLRVEARSRMQVGT